MKLIRLGNIGEVDRKRKEKILWNRNGERGM
jgi:hypothetical protein